MSGVVTSALSTVAEAEATWRRMDIAMRAGLVTDKLPEADLEAFELAGQLQHPGRLASVPLLWVASDMVDLLEHAAKTLPAQPFDPAGLPWDNAFVIFARPILSADVALSGATWGPIRHTHEWGDEAASHAIGGFVRKDGQLAVVLWSKVSAGSYIGELPAVGLDHDDPDGWARLLSALWLLVQQKVAVHRKVQPTRPDVRRWGREHERPIPEVTVVELRRPIQSHPHEDTPGGEVEWSHRWIVDGHWRNQWHPKLNAHIPTWIAPHVKGPDDKPLVVKRKINAWVR